MRIGILGAGALGCRLGFELAGIPGVEVRLLARSPGPDWVEVEGHGRRAVERGGADGPVDLLLVLVKAGDTREALAWAGGAVGQSTVLLTLQNGLGNAETLAEMAGPERVLVGTTAMGATLTGPGIVRPGGEGPTRIAPWVPEGMAAERAAAVAALLQAGLADDPARLLWSKLVINAGINALTAVLRVTNGGLLERPSARRLMEQAAREAYHVALAEGVILMDDSVEQVARVAAATAQNRSSMLQDLERGRRTEVEAINGEVVRRGRDYGVGTPVNQSLLELVRAMER